MIKRFLPQFESTQREEPASAFRKAMGVFLMAIGVSGLVLPFVQGILLISIGYLVFTNQDWKKVLKNTKRVVKKSAKKMKK